MSVRTISWAPRLIDFLTLGMGSLAASLCWRDGCDASQGCFFGFRQLHGLILAVDILQLGGGHLVCFVAHTGTIMATTAKTRGQLNIYITRNTNAPHAMQPQYSFQGFGPTALWPLDILYKVKGYSCMGTVVLKFCHRQVL